MMAARAAVACPSLHLLVGPQANLSHKVSLPFHPFAAWEPCFTHITTAMKAANHQIV